MPTEIWKFKDNAWQVINEIQYMDGATPRSITEVHYNDGGTWRQVFGSSVTAGTAAWASATPTGNYKSTDFETGGAAETKFTADTLGNFLFYFSVVESGSSTGSPSSGTYRDTAPVNDPSNFEISINAGTVSGSGVRIAVGSGTLLDGTWQNLDTTRGVRIATSGTGSGSISVTVEIREIATPANTTGAATFTLSTTVP